MKKEQNRKGGKIGEVGNMEQKKDMRGNKKGKNLDKKTEKRVNIIKENQGQEKRKEK